MGKDSHRAGNSGHWFLSPCSRWMGLLSPRVTLGYEQGWYIQKKQAGRGTAHLLHVALGCIFFSIQHSSAFYNLVERGGPFSSHSSGLISSAFTWIWSLSIGTHGGSSNSSTWAVPGFR